VLNMADHGFSVAGYDKDATKVDALQKESVECNIRAAANLLDFIAPLRKPRAVMLLVPAGAPVDSVIKDLLRTWTRRSHYRCCNSISDTDVRARNLRRKAFNSSGGRVRRRRRRASRTGIMPGAERGLRAGPSHL